MALIGSWSNWYTLTRARPPARRAHAPSSRICFLICYLSFELCLRCGSAPSMPNGRRKRPIQPPCASQSLIVCPAIGARFPRQARPPPREVISRRPALGGRPGLSPWEARLQVFAGGSLAGLHLMQHPFGLNRQFPSEYWRPFVDRCIFLGGVLQDDKWHASPLYPTEGPSGNYHPL